MRSASKTSEAFGRERGSWAQQRCINVHNFSVKAGCVGRGGRPPCMIANMAITNEPLPNGIVLVNACIDVVQQ